MYNELRYSFIPKFIIYIHVSLVHYGPRFTLRMVIHITLHVIKCTVHASFTLLLLLC